jgi:uncharacterized membrane protein
MGRKIAVRVMVFWTVLIFSFLPFLTAWIQRFLVGGDISTYVIREFVHSGEPLVMAIGFVAGAAGDLLTSTLRQEPARGRFTFAVIANFVASIAFLYAASFLYAAVFARPPGGGDAPAWMIVLGFFLSILIVISTMWLGEVRDAEQNERLGLLLSEQRIKTPSVWRTRVHRVLWGQTPAR